LDGADRDEHPLDRVGLVDVAATGGEDPAPAMSSPESVEE
jgi:hypothetical protein